MDQRSFFMLSALLCLGVCDAYKILVIFPLPSKSHSIMGEGVVRHLLNAGHEVTYITPFPRENPPPRLREIDVSDNGIPMPQLQIEALMNKEATVFDPQQFFNFTVGTVRATALNPKVMKMMDDPEIAFDVVIAEWMFSELYSAFATIYGCPFIWLSTVEPNSNILELVDEGLNPAYSPGLISTDVPPYSFGQRAKELFISIAGSVLKTLFIVRAEREVYEDVFAPLIKKKGHLVPTYDEVKYNVSLILGNSHVSLGHATRLPQSYKPIAGYHIDPNFKPLPEDLKKLLDNAKNGVIYFSMGSNLKSKSMPDKLKKSLLKMMGTLKQTVLWKFEEDIAGLPSNVHILKWAPQSAILSHPNCILFVTHGGILSLAEAMHYGQPTVGIPVFADQFANVERLIKKGWGKRVDLSYAMADDLKLAIEEVLGNPSYARTAKDLSLVFHDRPAPPGVELVHWVEHVIKTGGAPHLRSPALHVPFYQKMYLDLAAVLFSIVFALRIVVKKVCQSCRRTDSVKKNK